MVKKICILGSTGSIGTQSIEVIRRHPGRFRVTGLTAGSNARLLIQQARSLLPEQVAIANPAHYEEVREGLAGLPVEVLAGEEGVLEIAGSPSSQMAVVAQVGFSGLRPTLAALEAGKEIALANKETIVVAGEQVMKKAREKRVPVLPVDSEHSAVFQCLMGEEHKAVEKIILTASGGPFREKTEREIAQATPEEALRHPNWKMGDKITIDSASLMNKGLEVIEARWLFDVMPEAIEVVVHPQSVIHSMVQFRDGSIKAQLGHPDMRVPILVALGWPERLASPWGGYDFTRPATLTFFPVDTKKFRNLALSYAALERGGNMPCILNAANEVAVEAFLQRKTGFSEMSDIIEQTMARASFLPAPSLEELMASDREARRIAAEIIKKR